ncbi:DNA-binding XRE family transcriptional regulator [Agrobacterium vitis]|nr:DNA-binding XRE family transcriptional regulator [Agrobacterium vitis]
MQNFVREWRKFRRLAQKQLAARAEIGAQHISDIERGVENPSARTLEKLAAALQCTIHELLTVNPHNSAKPVARLIEPGSDEEIAEQLEQLAAIFAGLARLARQEPERLPMALQKARHIAAQNRNQTA